jgi:hypothetical protein
MLIISKSKYDAIPRDYKGTFQDYHNEAPQLKGRRTWLTKDESGTALLLEGVHFLVEGNYEHLPVLTRETAATGLAYAWCNSFQIVKEVYTISEEYAKENHLAYIDRVKTTKGDFALAGSRWSQYSQLPPQEQEKEPEEIPF